MDLQSVRAIYKDRVLIFSDPDQAPQDGTEVIVTFVERGQERIASGVDPIQALRGRGRGEKLVERLLQSRREDWERDERIHKHLRA